VEDIHGLMSLVKRTPKPSVLVVYYAKLTEIFWISESHLYHAYAWLKLFNLQRSYNKNLKQNDLQLLASSVLLAALSVTPYDHKYGASHLELENEKERSLRMANLVNFSLDSKRENREMVSSSGHCKYIFLNVIICFLIILLSPFQASRASLLAELVCHVTFFGCCFYHMLPFFYMSCLLSHLSSLLILPFVVHVLSWPFRAICNTSCYSWCFFFSKMKAKLCLIH
jgi:hypothetical protein